MRRLREQAVAAAVTTPAAAAAGSSAAFEAACVRALPWQWAGTGLNTFFALWTFGGSVFLLFLSELGLPKVQIGVVLALFPFCGLLALGFAPVAARLGRKRVFLGCYGARKVVMAGLRRALGRAWRPGGGWPCGPLRPRRGHADTRLVALRPGQAGRCAHDPVRPLAGRRSQRRREWTATTLTRVGGVGSR